VEGREADFGGDRRLLIMAFDDQLLSCGSAAFVVAVSPVLKIFITPERISGSEKKNKNKRKIIT